MQIFGLKIERAPRYQPPADLPSSLPPLPMHRLSWRRLLIWLLVCLPVLAIAGAGYISGFVVGNRKADHFDPFGADMCQTTASQMTANAMFRRNIIWKVWNDPSHADLSDEDAKFAVALGMALHPTTPAASRPLFIKMLVLRPYVSLEPLQMLEGEEDAVMRINELRAYSCESIENAEMMRQILCDSHRISLFINQRPIPLEHLPNGKVP